MATFLLIHGGWHGGWCWRWVAPRLRAAGHEVLSPTLTGLAERAHLVRPLGDALDLDTHVGEIAELLTYEDLEGVVAVGHSYGGMVLRGVADRAGERLAHLVYLDAFVPADGESLFDLLRPERREALAELARAHGDGRLVPPPGPAQLGVIDPDRSAWLAARLTAQPLRTFTQPLRLSAPATTASLPRSYVHCTQGPMTASFAPVLDRLRAAPGWRTHELATGHDAMVTAPEAVAELLAEVGAALDDRSSRGRAERIKGADQR